MRAQDDINKNWFNVCSDLMAQTIDLRMQLNAAQADMARLKSAQTAFATIKDQTEAAMKILSGPQGDIGLDVIETQIADIALVAEMQLDELSEESRAINKGDR